MMRIDSVASQPDRAGRHLVRFEDGSTMRLYRQTVEDFSLYPGREMDAQELRKLQEAAGAMSAKMRAIRILSAASVSKSDLQRRLVHKGEDPRQAQAAVQWLEDMSLLDDRQTAYQVVQRCISKGYGIARAKQALYEKRIPKDLWEEALADYPEQTEPIVAFLRNRLGSDWDKKDLQRAIDALLRRGHSYHDIRRGLDRLSVDTEDFPEE
ncbi:MAG: RecX family transcriptional regulator [Oscillospiraceae bacterium]|nr:RecX family transcriptional regulator [Oscillospiraceae bacterium]